MANCTYTWTTQNGVNGGKVTGPNGASIFFPASGYRSLSDGSLRGVGLRGVYWSATPDGGYYGRCLHFVSSGWNWDSSRRVLGYPVRAVAE